MGVDQPDEAFAGAGLGCDQRGRVARLGETGGGFLDDSQAPAADMATGGFMRRSLAVMGFRLGLGMEGVGGEGGGGGNVSDCCSPKHDKAPPRQTSRHAVELLLAYP